MMQVWRRVAHFFYGLYACVAFLTVALPALALIVSLPGLANRRRMARHSARLAFRMMGVPINVRNIESVPDAGCVVVANHASYLDGVILTAVLPANFSFVIKQEVRRVPVAHLMLRRLGSHFVERFDRHRSAVDTRRILRAASAGHVRTRTGSARVPLRSIRDGRTRRTSSASGCHPRLEGNTAGLSRAAAAGATRDRNPGIA